MSKGGYRTGRPRLPIESCHSLSVWGYFQFAQMWQQIDETFQIEWQFAETVAYLQFTRDGIVRFEEIQLEYTLCNFGGRRAWFICPNCGSRVGKVYLPETYYVGDVRIWRFACRRCYYLSYEQQRSNRNRQQTYEYRAERIAERWLGEISGDWIQKKKWQRWRTFERRAEQYENLLQLAEAEMNQGRIRSCSFRRAVQRFASHGADS